MAVAEQQIGTPVVGVSKSIGSSWAMAFSLLVLVGLWVTAVSRWHTALQQDMAEQFVWAHAWQWGYPKHPPLPTWLFKAVLEVFPAQPATLYGLAALCMALTGVFTFLAARELLGPRLALPVVLLWSLQQPFSWRAWIYNHNTVLVMCIAATAWCVLCATRRPDRRWWLAAGVAVGLSLLTKIQALVPLAGMLWALWRSGQLQSSNVRRGVGLATAVALLACSPWLVWLVTGHGDVLFYAAHQLGGDVQGESQVHLLTFVVIQLRMLAPALVVCLGWVWLAGRSSTPAQRRSELSVTERAWLEGLCLVPLVGVLLTGLLSGATLHGQWGVQTFQFAAVALTLGFASKLKGVPMRALVLGALALHAIGLLAMVSSVAPRLLGAPGPVIGYPARMLASEVEQDWARVTACPLRYVAGPFIEAGQVSAFARDFPAVLEDGQGSKSPWIDLNDVALRGSVVLARSVAQLPETAIHLPHMQLIPATPSRFVAPVFWAIQPPRVACATPTPAGPPPVPAQ